MSNQENFNKAVGWLIGEWLEEDGVQYTEQLFKEAQNQVSRITGHYGDTVPPMLAELPWYEVEGVVEIYFGYEEGLL
tara:strand:- start:642 stop:872 length:231 start_codon:yes stop_codon:yes gene_type:complete